MKSFNQKTVTVATALAQIRRGGRIFIGSGCAEPLLLANGLIEHAEFFADNPVIHILTQGEAAYTRPEFAANFRHNAFFIGPNVREAVQEGRADYTPIFLSEIPALFRSGPLPLDTALIQVTPPDAQGFCSLGVSIDVVKAAAQSARLVIAQVNSHMPRTFGDSFVHLDEIDLLVEGNEPIREIQAPPQTEVTRQIGANVAQLVRDGATLQMGIGGIPNAVLARLTQKNDLGIHTEMFSDGLMELVDLGVVTGRRKTLHNKKIVTSFCMGTRKLYDWVHENPHVEFYGTDYTNDPGIIRQNEDMVAINSAIAIDLTGQVCSDSIGSRFYSGIGGQVDFMRGAARSLRGRPIIALPSTAKSGTISRIVAALSEGSGVVTSRGDVHYVVTEYGIASLHGKSVTERARALVEIAHPDFRNELLDAARERRYTYGDLRAFSKTDIYPAHLEARLQFERPGAEPLEVFFRPLRPTDDRLLQDFFYSHSEATVRGRYGYLRQELPHSMALRLVQLNYRNRLAMAGFVGDPGSEKMVAIGRYEADTTTRVADINFVTGEEYRNLGIAQHLVGVLHQAAITNGMAGIECQIKATNRPMLHILNKVLGAPDQSSDLSGYMVYKYNFEDIEPQEDFIGS